ncbi:MAG: TetR/AcrR family transcriptional regulator [Clostridia bacterium]|nr:TetR/AcrR family transcriptional regulator [Clostridia bacterium]
MDPIKRKIIESATTLFAEKGFSSTSVQEIAENSNIAKGMVYKFFSSKESLFIEVFNIRQKKLIEHMNQINNDNTLTPRECLKSAIIFHLHFYVENKYILVSNPLQENEAITQSRKSAVVWLLNWRKECLLKTYGDTIGNRIWDLSILFRGILREYSYLLIDKSDIFVPMEDIAEFIVGIMDTIVYNIGTYLKEPPLFKESIFNQNLIAQSNKYFESIPNTLTSVIQTMQMIIENLPANSNREELIKTIDLLKAEFEQTEPRWFLIRALLLFLESEERLSSLVKQTIQLVRTIEKTNGLSELPS